MSKDKSCQCNVCRLQRGEITTEQALENELKEKRQLERLLIKGKGDLWAIGCNLDFCNMFIEDLQKTLKGNKDAKVNKNEKAEKQKDKIFKELINEIDNMSVEEYNKYHQEALKMKKAHDDMIQALSNTLSN